MKARFYLAMAAAALLMSNCSQDEPMAQSQGGTNTLTATIEGASRSAVTDAGVFSWTAGDAFSVYNGEGFTTFTLSSGNVFTSNETITPSGVAIYPAGTEHDYDGTTAKVNLATSYNYGSTNAPMLAEVASGTLNFKHVGGLMRFIVKGMPNTASSFTFTANTGIAGDFEVSDGKITSKSDNTKSVTINFTTDQYNAESMTFYIPLPTGTYEGYTVSIGDGQGMSNQSDAAVKNTIDRGTLLLMPTFTYDATNGLSKGTDGGVVTLEGGEQSLAVSGTQAVEVDASGLGDVEAVLSLNYTPEDNSTLTLSESGDVVESQEESAATVSVSVPNSSTVNQLDINMPSMTVELNAEENETATYTTVNALTAQNTLKIGKGVSVGTLNIKGGHVRLAGSITSSITREVEGTDIIYIILEEGVEAPTVTLPNNVKVVTAAEWDLRKAIENDNSYTLESNLTINEALTIPSEKIFELNLGNKTLTIEGNSISYGLINKGSMTIKNGTITFVGDGTNGAAVCNMSKIQLESVNVTSNSVCFRNWGDVTVKKLDGKTVSDAEVTAVINGGTFASSFSNTDSHSQHRYTVHGYFLSNMTMNGSIVTGSGGIHVDVSFATLTNVTATANCQYGAHDLYVAAGNATVDDCTFANAAAYSDATYGNAVVNNETYEHDASNANGTTVAINLGSN